MVRVTLQAVRVDLQSNTPVLLLQESDGEGRTLPIFIGTPEATAIAYATQGIEVPRPLTHDLLVDWSRHLTRVSVKLRSPHSKAQRSMPSCTSFEVAKTSSFLPDLQMLLRSR